MASWRRMFGGIVERTDGGRVVALLAGLCAGLILVGALDVVLLRFGYTPESTAAIVLVAGCVMSLLGRHRVESGTSGRTGIAVLAVGAVAAAGLPWTASWATALLATVPYSLLGSAPVRLVAMIAIVALLLGPVLVGVVRWPAIVRSRHGRCEWRTYGLGLVGGVLLAVTAIAATLGTFGPMLVGIGGLIVAAFVLRFVGCEPASEAAVSDETSTGNLGRIVGSVLLGIAAVCVGRLTFEWFLPSAALLHVAWVAPLMGAILFAGRRWAPSNAVVPVAIGVGWAIGLVALHGSVVETVLFLNAHAESLWVQVLAKSGFVLLLGLPVGIAWGLLGRSETETGRIDWLASPAAFAVGFVVGGSVVPVFGEAVVLAALAVVVGGWLAVGTVATRAVPTRWAGRIALFGSTAFLLAGPLWTTRHRPERSAKLLFSTHVVVAERNGADARFREQRDPSRLVVARPGAFGTHTVWSHFGLQHELRDGGIPVGFCSREPRVCPQSPIDTLVSTVPLVLHDAPRRVLHLGLDAGVPLASTLEFPVLSVTCVEPDRARTALLADVVWGGSPDSPLHDDRVRVVDVAPRLAVRCDPETYDVVISNPSHSGIARVAPSFTPDFYADCRDRLAEGGIFCQRLRSIDYGLAVTNELLQGFRGAFAESLVVFAGSGELLLIGSRDPERLHPADLARRWAAPHVRQVLARAGWDWSTPLTMRTLDENSLQLLAEEHGGAGGSSRHSYRLARETIRWGNKYREQSAALGKLAAPILDALPRQDQYVAEATTRIADVERAITLRRENPDEWWRYRTTLKRQLQGSPRTRIEKVSHQSKPVHPVDRHRLDFLVALGEASRADEPPTIGEIHRVLGFARRPDPLVDYFARAESTRLFARCPERLPREELEQRLWLVLHDDSLDRSVRNVTATIQLVAAHPETLPDDASRWDVLNGLLQNLTNRWTNRARQDPLPTNVLVKDIGLTLDARDRAFEAMEALADAGVSSREEWEARAGYLDSQLTVPLKEYRETLRAHRAREERRARAAAGIEGPVGVEAEDPDDADTFGLDLLEAG